MTDSVNSSNVVTTRFEKILGVVEKKLRLALEEAREGLEHKGNKGSTVEAEVRDVLRKYLPRHYGVGQGEIYDAFGDGTGQVDVIITNPDHPFAYPDDVVGPHLLDGIAAVGEVKSVLTTSELEKVIASATRFKTLRPTAQMGDRVLNQSNEFTKETLALPPYFLVVFENRVAIDTLRKTLTLAPHAPVPSGKDGPAQHPVDAVFVLGKHVLINTRSGHGPFQYTVPMKGWLSFPTDKPLSWLVTWLHKAMPRIDRHESVLTPYLLPFDDHKRYMATRTAEEVFDIREDEAEASE
ncbi:hypothetical protein APR11_000025 [Nocardia amikacinitolerans]|uniref:DUF6602 domain-containing protein n=1 Tax=Nocardia amikacinitolerans TaxID=756689 RepID=UPI0020A3A7E1|nr:DUF6602 domain-containing protein [Nocardia amikacinitolerans]MCP2293621.1 hypothetical protein [Nocardia amikacinitolerans]